MPSDDAYDKVLAELSRLNRAWEQSVSDLTSAWQLYREVINRAVNQLNHEVLEFKDRLDKDDAAREKRQEQVDRKLEQITDGQQSIRRWQLIRLGVELGTILIIAAYLYGLSR